MQFQSTQPKRAATTAGRLKILEIRISIHAAQEGCDGYNNNKGKATKDFNPRSPRGLRHDREVTMTFDGTISIHAAQEGCDAAGHHA